MAATQQTFGGGTTDFILDPGNDAKPLPNTPYTIIDGETMEPATGLVDGSGAAVTQLTSDADGRYAGGAMLEGVTYWLDAVGAKGPFRAGPQVSTTALANVVAMGPQLDSIASSAAASAFSAKSAQAAAEAAAAGATAPANSAIDSHLGADATGLLDSLGKVKPGRLPQFFVPTTGDFATNLQATLDAARGKGQTVVLPGAYDLKNTVSFGQGDHLIAYGATITRVSPCPGNMFRNFTTADVAGAGFAAYSGKGHITVEGGVFDSNGGVYTSTGGNVFTFDHATRIRVMYATIKNVSSWHGVELNAVDDGKVLYCKFLGFKDNTVGAVNGAKEAVQIDVANSGSIDVPAYDGTHSRNILIHGNTSGPSETLPAQGQFVGSHSRLDASTWYEGIRITDNHITSPGGTAIRGYGWRRPIITGNQIYSPGAAGISMDQSDHPVVFGNTVVDPVTQGVRVTATTVGGVIANNDIIRPTTDGISVSTGCDGTIVHSNHVYDGKTYGITVSGAMKDVDVSGNVVVGCGLNGGVASAIRVSVGVQTSKIHDNTVRKSGAAGETTTGLSVTSDCVGIMYYGNDFRGMDVRVSDTSTTSGLGGDDTGWIDCIITAGYAKRGTDATYTPQVRLLNGVVYLRGQMDRTVGVWNTGTITPLTLPTNVAGVASFAPPKEHSIWPAGNTLPSAWVRTAGTIGVTGSAATGALVLDNVCWPLN